MVIQMFPGVLGDSETALTVVAVAESFGLQTKISQTQGAGTIVTEVYLIDGPDFPDGREGVRACSVPEHVFRQLPGVDSVRRVTPSKVSLASNGVAGGHAVKIGSQVIGIGHPCALIMGPCTVDKYTSDLVDQLVNTHGIKIIRGGCWKPRTSPYAFPGFGEQAVRWLLEGCKQAGAEGACLEVLESKQIDLVRRIRDEVGYAGAIVLWVGARTANLELLRELGKQDEFVVMLKNPIHMRRVAEWISLAEFVIAGEMHFDNDGKLIPERSLRQGNDRILLCSRGVESGDPQSIYRCDPRHEVISSVQHRYWPPVGVDPSHSAGTMQNSLVLTNLRAALPHLPAFAVVECYFDHDSEDEDRRPLCDATQAVPLSRLREVQDIITEHNAKHYGVCS